MFEDDDEPAPPSPAAPAEPLDRESQELWNYLLEVVGDYERYISDIGNLGYAAPQLLYYRDEIEEMLQEFKTDRRVDFRSVWLKVKALDEVLRRRQQEVVDEIGHNNFKQYQIINDPPRTHWWWWLNRVTQAPPPQPAWWQFWKPAVAGVQADEDASAGASAGEATGQGHGQSEPEGPL